MNGSGPQTGTSSGVSRRYLLAQGTRLVGLGGVGALAAALGLPAPAAGQDWAAELKARHQGGHGTVKRLQGTAMANGQALAEGSRVASGAEVRTGAGSFLIVSLVDGTILRVNANTTVTLDVGRNRTGLFRLLVGALLTVMPSGNRYVAVLPTAVIGVKGTVFYQQIFHPGESVALDAKARQVRLPPGIREYFCLCTGMADYLAPEGQSLYFTDRSQYHNSYYIDPTAPNPMVPAPQLNHTDDQIRDLIQRQEGPKHSTRFLDNYVGGGDVDP